MMPSFFPVSWCFVCRLLCSSSGTSDHFVDVAGDEERVAAMRVREAQRRAEGLEKLVGAHNQILRTRCEHTPALQDQHMREAGHDLLDMMRHQYHRRRGS